MSTRYQAVSFLHVQFQIRPLPKPGSTAQHCKTEAEFLEELLGCDEGWLRVFDPLNNEAGLDPAKRATLYLVYGNSPGEIVCDYSWNKAATGEFTQKLDAATREHNDKWENRKQPTAVRG